LKGKLPVRLKTFKFGGEKRKRQEKERENENPLKK